MNKPAASASSSPRPSGRLDWRLLLRWLVDDALITADAAAQLARRFEAGDSSLHPLVRLGGGGPDIWRLWPAGELVPWAPGAK